MQERVSMGGQLGRTDVWSGDEDGGGIMYVCNGYEGGSK